jgi:hypothetical protein
MDYLTPTGLCMPDQAHFPPTRVRSCSLEGRLCMMRWRVRHLAQPGNERDTRVLAGSLCFRTNRSQVLFSVCRYCRRVREMLCVYA